MKVKKYPQSCLLVTTAKHRILVDPGNLKYQEKFMTEWLVADIILVTHRHADHCNVEVIKSLNRPIYSTKEVAKACPELKNINIVKSGMKPLKIGDVSIEVVDAVHGYNPRLKHNKAEVHENVGFIIDDGETRLYVTSDTICFNNEYKADYVAAPITGYGLTMTAFETGLFAKETGAKQLIVTHLDNETYPTDVAVAEKTFQDLEVAYTIPAIGEEFEIKGEPKEDHGQKRKK